VASEQRKVERKEAKKKTGTACLTREYFFRNFQEGKRKKNGVIQDDFFYVIYGFSRA